MGIYKLLSYINNDCDVKFPQMESGNSVYVSNVTYFDLMFKIVELYNNFFEQQHDETADIIELTNELFKYIANELRTILTKLIAYNRAVFVFVDYRFPKAFGCKNVLYKDFMNMQTIEREKINSIPMIKRKHISAIESDEIAINSETFKRITNGVRCEFEINYAFAKSAGVRVTDFISIPCLLKRAREKYGPTDNVCIMKLKTLINVGRLRYHLIRGGKLNTRIDRRRTNFGFFSDTVYVKDNINKTLFNVYNSNDNLDALNRWKNYVPLSLVIFAFPRIISMINIRNVYYLGCGLESDFALAKHVRSYSKAAFPTIYTNDTDLLVLLADVPCMLKMMVKRKIMLINPVEFWRKLFGCKLSTKVISIMCVLMGTDYNPHLPGSPLHINAFTDVLKLLNVRNYSAIDEDALKLKIYEMLSEYKDHPSCSQTALAINIYTEPHETSFIYLSNIDVNKINVKMYLDMSRKSMFNVDDGESGHDDGHDVR